MEVTQLEKFEDPGATAIDNIDGALPVQTSAETEVDTTHPTAADAPYVIRYSATDAAGNSADPVERR
eukprot:180785-Pyramimonas_sp.AAC.1